jgi:hypothetical protein
LQNRRDKRAFDVHRISVKTRAVKDNEGHGFANEVNRFEFYAAMEAFFAKRLKP